MTCRYLRRKFNRSTPPSDQEHADRVLPESKTNEAPETNLSQTRESGRINEVIIRQAKFKDAELLPPIENSAGQAFRQLPDLAWLADGDDLSAEWHRKIISQGTSWVAAEKGDRPIGFLSAESFDQDLHIWELSVRQDRQRAGIGRRLIERSIEQAKARHLTFVTLTTFRDVPWNEPFYARLGFVTLREGEIGPRLDEILRTEIGRGWPAHRRCAMRLSLEEQDDSNTSGQLVADPR